ncbi:thioredoxin-like protein [Kalaharituber pfeilii]|nr:thioredoxin-like protein [Kalaharituber pfeilii]
MVNISIDIFSDTVCPWCYIGHLKLYRAISLFRSLHHDPSHTFTLTYHPFYLNPAAPQYPGTPTLTALTEKFGATRLAQIHMFLSGAGNSVGVQFNHGSTTGSTRDSHRLLYLIKEKFGPEAQIKVVERVFKGYFQEKGNITDRDMLARWAVEGTEGMESGVTEELVKAWFEEGNEEGDEAGKIVDREARWAAMRGTSGVPDYKINDRWRLSGAREPEEFVKVFERVLEEEERRLERERGGKKVDEKQGKERVPTAAACEIYGEGKC